MRHSDPSHLLPVRLEHNYDYIEQDGHMETPEWPPEGYSAPRKYEMNDWMPYIVALLAGGITLAVFWNILDRGTDSVSEFIVGLLVTLGLAENDITLLLGVFGSLLVISLILYIGWQKILTPIHEEIHFRVSKRLCLEPEHTETVLLGMVNQSVTNWKTGITRKEHIISLGSPLVAIGVIIGVLSIVSSGLVAGTLALIVVANTTGSGGDIYHIYRIVRKPPGTLFANFECEDGNEIRTEYVLPEKPHLPK